MRNKKKMAAGILFGLMLAMLILDSKTALLSGRSAVELCIQVLIPSLFPFFVISTLLTGAISGTQTSVFKPLGKLLGLPQGAESILLIGFLGGYPVGAAAIAQSCQSGQLRNEDARRMLAFCSNAGPSFIFGIGSQLFPQIRYCWLLWGIHILSALIVSLMTGGKSNAVCTGKQAQTGITGALKKGLVIMASVCGWVILFRVLIGFLDRWILWLLPQELQILLTGLLELANGIAVLSNIGNLGQRMLLFSAMLSFGGLCVWMQTMAVTSGTDNSLYLPGKITQSAVSVLLTSAAQFLLPVQQRYVPNPVLLLICCLSCVFYVGILQKSEKRSGNSMLLGV